MNKRKILVVDDDKFIRMMLQLMLKREGYAVDVADNGNAALEQIAASQPDLVIMDGLLPGKHGFEVCKEIKAKQNPPKIVLFTGIYTKPNQMRQGVSEYGADEVLAKNDCGEILECLGRLLGPAVQIDSEPAADFELCAAV